MEKTAIETRDSMLRDSPQWTLDIVGNRSAWDLISLDARKFVS
jgi:hypothetical protein